MVINKSKQYIKDYKKIIIKKHFINEQIRIKNIENLIISSKNMHDLLENPYKVIYHIEAKKGSLKEYYTARINDKLRLVMKPNGEYPYETINIEEIEFINIDDKHYGEG